MSLHVATDLPLGGRWTSLRSVTAAGEREWLWRNPVVPYDQRAAVRPGQAFVDAGGGEECFPSVTGAPEDGHDHGDVWSRPWVGTQADAAARTRTGLTLRRRLREDGGAVRADYEISGPVGTPVLHAVHLLLAVGPQAQIVVPGEPAVTVLDRPRPGSQVRTTWPDGDGVGLDHLGPDDGTARCAVVASSAVEIIDGADRLQLRWGTDSGAPTSFLLWRNLGGWPDGGPYRSFGIEPMLGATGALATAAPEEVAVISERALTWWLEIGAEHTGAVVGERSSDR